jgi:tetrahydromethanopterin S-methyltransferase subunit B
MLFAMSTMDKVKVEKIKESTKKTFGDPNSKKEGKFVVAENTQELKSKIEESQKKVEESKKINEALENKIKAMDQLILKIQSEKETIQKESETSQKTLTEEITQLKQQKAVPIPKVEPFKEKIKELEKINNNLKQTVAQLRKEKTPVKEPKVIPPPPPQEKVEPLKEKIKELEQITQKLQEKVDNSQVTIQTITAQLKEAQSNVATSNFMAFMMKWPTKDHDIDLKVEDPSGHIFDFKHRKYNASPGMFVLDTRRGPGMEVWQTDKIVPGVYKFTFQFYNAYGNPEPCPVSGTLFTTKGTVELPTITLDPNTKREAAFLIELDEKGKATLKK